MKRGSETILVKLKSEGQRKVWENKKKLRGRKKRIMDDLMKKKEDEMEIGGDNEEKEMRRGNRVSRKVNINGQ